MAELQIGYRKLRSVLFARFHIVIWRGFVLTDNVTSNGMIVMVL